MDPGALFTDLLKQLTTFAAQQALQEIKLIVDVDEEVQNLQASFEKVQAMLNNAEERQVTDKAVKLWLDQLRDAYCMMDDVLDKWNTARIKSKIQKEEEEAADINTHAVKKKVCSFPSPTCCFSQADNLTLRRDIGHKIKKLTETLDKILKDKVTYGFDLTNQPSVVEPPKTTCFVDVSNIIGRDNHMTDLLSNLLGEANPEERKPPVISLVGMGGLGKTTLAQLAYNDPKVQAHFEKLIWVCVSNPFDQCRVAKAIINVADPKILKTITDDVELQSLLDIICNLIGGKKFFLILDDAWTEDFKLWEPFKDALRCGAEGSRILVTTRNVRVAKIMGSVHMIKLELLSDKDCWLIFSKIAFFNGNQCEDLEDLGKKLAIKCKGLPLAVKTLGFYMLTKTSREQRKNVLDSTFWELENSNKGILAPFLLSYYDLHFTMRRCFSYCAVFPKDHRFDKEELVLLWMAQGFIDSKENMEMMAEEYLEVLAMRSFFQDFEENKYDGSISFKMHDIVHDFAQSRTQNECFTFHGEKEFMNVYEVKKSQFCKSARHLSLIVKETFPLELYEVTNLRSLNMEFSSSPHTVLPDLFQHLTCLRTLVLQGDSIVKLPDEVEKLIHLRFLKLYNTEIVELRETMCNLCNLQTLSTTLCK